jgi:type I restriction enzyme, S subunit
MINAIPASKYCHRIFDGTHETPKPVNSGRHLVTSKNIKGGILDRSSCYFISEEDYQDIQKRSYVSQWDVMFSMIGSVGDVYLEKNPEIDYAVKNVGVFSCLNEEKAKWLYYFLRTQTAQAIVRNQLNGAVQKFLPLGALRNFPIPAFDSSKKSALKLLSALDARIELNNQINAELEGMAKLLYDYWFVQYDFPMTAEQATSLGRPALEGRPYKSSGGKMAYNATLSGFIPIDWVAITLNEIGSFKNGINYSPTDTGDTQARIINVRNVSSSSFFLKNSSLDELCLKGTAVSKYLATEKSILITRSGIPGATRLIQNQRENTVYCGFIICFEPRESKNRNPVFFYMKRIEKSMTSNAAGTVLKNVSQDTLKSLCLSLPSNISDNTVDKFNAIIDPIFNLIGNLQEQNQELTQLRDWLLPMLMNGQVTVSA